MQGGLDRRSFTQTVGVLAGAAAASPACSASERIRVGFIGVGNRGDQVLSAFLEQPDAQVVALADVYQPYLEAAGKRLAGSPRLLRDYRELLAMKDLDAVVVATPDHWHALQFIDACRAGKHVYVEKPLSLTIDEGRRMVDVARSTGRVTQMGVQRRSAPGVQQAVKLLREGAIGKMTFARCYHLANESPMGIGNPPDEAPPAGLDWDAWLGPARKVPYNRNRCLYKFRWFWDYSGGQLTNFGVHYLDVIQWALGEEIPASAVALGGKYAVRDNRDIPDTMEAVWEYPSGALVAFSQIDANAAGGNARPSEIEFRGTEGTLYLRGGGFEIVPEKVRERELPALSPLERKANAAQSAARRPAGKPMVVSGGLDEAAHVRNFLDAVQGRAALHCPVDVGYRSTLPTLMARVSYLTGLRVHWDDKLGQFAEPAANRLLAYAYREPWRLE